jgi:site-specific DNA-methyltransferase (adenine-specific)
MRKMPPQKPGRSEQVVLTPPDFLKAVRTRLGIVGFHIDLAADATNTVAPQFFSETDNALEQSWYFGPGAWGWANPPFHDLGSWTQKALFEMMDRQAQVAMLVPASVGSNWWSANVHNVAQVLFLNGRLTFVGHTTPYPKDLALLLYLPQIWQPGYEVWRWK